MLVNTEYVGMDEKYKLKNCLPCQEGGKDFTRNTEQLEKFFFVKGDIFQD